MIHVAAVCAPNAASLHHYNGCNMVVQNEVNCFRRIGCECLCSALFCSVQAGKQLPALGVEL